MNYDLGEVRTTDENSDNKESLPNLEAATLTSSPTMTPRKN